MNGVSVTISTTETRASEIQKETSLNTELEIRTQFSKIESGTLISHIISYCPLTICFKHMRSGICTQNLKNNNNEHI